MHEGGISSLKIGGSFDLNFHPGAVLGILEPGQSDEEDEVEEGKIPRTWLPRLYLLEFPLKGAVPMPHRCPSKIFCLCIDQRLISTFWLQEALMSTGY